MSISAMLHLASSMPGRPLRSDTIQSDSVLNGRRLGEKRRIARTGGKSQGASRGPPSFFHLIFGRTSGNGLTSPVYSFSDARRSERLAGRTNPSQIRNRFSSRPFVVARRDRRDIPDATWWKRQGRVALKSFRKGSRFQPSHQEFRRKTAVMESESIKTKVPQKASKSFHPSAGSFDAAGVPIRGDHPTFPPRRRVKSLGSEPERRQSAGFKTSLSGRVSSVTPLGFRSEAIILPSPPGAG